MSDPSLPADSPKPVSTTTTKELQKKLERVEATSGPSGAIPNTPKQMLLDARDIESANPDKRYRWGSLSNPDKLEMRTLSGYQRVPAAEGGKQVGQMVLLALPRVEYETRVRAILTENERRLTQHNREVEQMAEAVAKTLRDKYGLKLNAEDIIVRG